MRKNIKKHYKDILLVVGYTIAAIIIYVALLHNLCGLWWVDLITAIVVIAVGVTCGIIYIKSLIKKDQQQDETPKQ